MAQNLTFTMIKPCAVRNQHIGAILKIISERGFSYQSHEIDPNDP